MSSAFTFLKGFIKAKEILLQLVINIYKKEGRAKFYQLWKHRVEGWLQKPLCPVGTPICRKASRLLTCHLSFSGSSNDVKIQKPEFLGVRRLCCMETESLRAQSSYGEKGIVRKRLSERTENTLQASASTKYTISMGLQVAV